jgi:hypothetical protein
VSDHSKDRPLGGDSYETGALTHRAHSVLPVAVISAAGLTALRDRDFSFAMGAAVAWALVLMLGSLAASHQWDVCSLCDGPPRQTATPEARARLARRLHSRWRRETTLFMMGGVMTAALMPKPYLDHVAWWGRVAETAVLTATAFAVTSLVRSVALHLPHRSECHREGCRADRHKAPGRVQAALAHYGVWALLVLLPGVTTVGVLAVQRKGNLPYLYATALLLVVHLMLTMARHYDTPCLLCAKRLPSNGGDLAERRMRWLRLWHTARLALVAAALTMWLVSWAFPGTVAGRVLVGLAGLTLTAQLLLNRTHGRVKPWCPWCREGGEDEHSETPDPARNNPVPV